jgi:hypothetical protein
MSIGQSTGSKEPSFDFQGGSRQHPGYLNLVLLAQFSKDVVDVHFLTKFHADQSFTLESIGDFRISS